MNSLEVLKDFVCLKLIKVLLLLYPEMLQTFPDLKRKELELFFY